MKDFQKFRNIEINHIQGSTKILISIRYVRKGYALVVKFGKWEKRLIPWIISDQESGNSYIV